MSAAAAAAAAAADAVFATGVRCVCESWQKAGTMAVAAAQCHGAYIVREVAGNSNSICVASTRSEFKATCLTRCDLACKVLLNRLAQQRRTELAECSSISSSSGGSSSSSSSSSVSASGVGALSTTGTHVHVYIYI